KTARVLHLHPPQVRCNYFGVYGNLPSLNVFYFHAIRTLWKFLNRRSQRKSYNLAGFKQLVEQFGVAKPHIVGRPKRDRRTMFVPAWLNAFAEASTSEEPGAIIPHAGICAGAVG
ncbi:MAG: hypothetical protein ABIJ39_10260, partial [Chloroflexota bacterium]